MTAKKIAENKPSKDGSYHQKEIDKTVASVKKIMGGKKGKGFIVVASPDGENNIDLQIVAHNVNGVFVKEVLNTTVDDLAKSQVDLDEDCDCRNCRDNKNRGDKMLQVMELLENMNKKEDFDKREEDISKNFNSLIKKLRRNNHD